jgi:hypothetical protein
MKRGGKMAEYNYYKEQLKRVQIEENLRLKIYGEFGETNVLDLNRESVPIIIHFLSELIIAWDDAADEIRKGITNADEGNESGLRCIECMRIYEPYKPTLFGYTLETPSVCSTCWERDVKGGM